MSTKSPILIPIAIIIYLNAAITMRKEDI